MRSKRKQSLRVVHPHCAGSRSLLVIDEVHASDAYMTEVLKHLLDGRGDSGAADAAAIVRNGTPTHRRTRAWRTEPHPT